MHAALNEHFHLTAGAPALPAQREAPPRLMAFVQAMPQVAHVHYSPQPTVRRQAVGSSSATEAGAGARASETGGRHNTGSQSQEKHWFVCLRQAHMRRYLLLPVVCAGVIFPLNAFNRVILVDIQVSIEHMAGW